MQNANELSEETVRVAECVIIEMLANAWWENEYLL
jgi:hypothetical protein